MLLSRPHLTWLPLKETPGLGSVSQQCMPEHAAASRVAIDTLLSVPALHVSSSQREASGAPGNGCKHLKARRLGRGFGGQSTCCVRVRTCVQISSTHLDAGWLWWPTYKLRTQEAKGKLVS